MPDEIEHVDAVIDLRRFETLEKGAVPGKGGEPPLHRAAKTGAGEATRLLLEHGADPNLTDPEQGNSALMRAANRGALAIVRLLLAHGASVDIVAKDGWTALQAAEMIGDAEIAALLRAAGARR